jgi:hypothetical protein
MAGGRKLFLTHAGELAHHLVAAIVHDAKALEFVREYAKRHERHKLLTSAERLREMEATISREALLLIAADVRRLLARALGPPRHPQPENLTFCDLFYTEFLEALSRALRWEAAERPAEFQAFQRDLAMYETWGQRHEADLASAKAQKEVGPFRDRCAILLDPAMMEQARRAAAEFQADLLRLGKTIFGRLGRQAPRRAVSNKARRAAHARTTSGGSSDKRARAGGKATKRSNRQPRRG